MRDISGISTQTVWSLSYGAVLPLVSVFDLTTLEVIASGTLPGTFGPSGLAVVPCGGAFVAQSLTSEQSAIFNFLRTGAVVQAYLNFTAENVLACAWDPANSRLAVLTSAHVLEVTPSTLGTPWSTAHGLTLNSVGSIDVDRNGNVAIAGGGQVQVYSGSTGAIGASTAVAGVQFCRFDAQGNIYVGGSGSLEKYGSGLAPLVWSNSTAIAALSVGDQSLWIEVDSGATRTVKKLSQATGAIVSTAANCLSPCALPGDQAAAIQLAFGSLGPTLCLISPSGAIARTGDLIAAYENIATNVVDNVVVYTATDPTILEPGVGRIGAFAW